MNSSTDDPLTAIHLRQSTIAALREALSVDDTREDELRAEVDKWRVALEEARAHVSYLRETPERDAMFHHAVTKSPSRPGGWFSPLNIAVKNRMIAEAEMPVFEAEGRLAFAERALAEYLEGRGHHAEL